MLERRNRFAILTMIFFICFGTFSILIPETSFGAVSLPKMKDVFLDSKDTLHVSLDNWVKITTNSACDFVLQEDGGKKIAIKSVTDLAADKKALDPMDIGFELIDDGKKVKFVLSPGCLGFSSEAKDNLEIYLVGEMNKWGKDKSVLDAAWKMSWNDDSGCYELTKEVGKGNGQVFLDSRFRFKQTASPEARFYPQYNLRVYDYKQYSNFVKITLAAQVDPTKNFVLLHPDYAPTDVTKRGVLNSPEFIYDGDDLGAIYSHAKTAFRLWSPGAKAVSVILYETQDTFQGQEIPMVRDVRGTWKAVVEGDLKNKYYMYRIHTNGVVNDTVDPYAHSLSLNGNRSIIIDLTETNPEGWEQQKIPAFSNPLDAIIYEVHVRDFTINPNSGVSQAKRGKYLGFTETGTTSVNGVKTTIDHLKELGITHVQILPVADFNFADEQSNDPKVYNWGYDPKHYNSPDGWYATDPSNGVARIKELKQLIKALHENGIRVVMDVVYNHTYTTGDSWFDLTENKYFYRTELNGRFVNPGFGNVTASENPMMRKFMLDSLKYWANEYKIDGFRFDVMRSHDKETMALVEKELRKIDPAMMIYGETFVEGKLDVNPDWKLMIPTNQRNMRIGVFNEKYYSAIRGDIAIPSSKGFVNGGVGFVDAVKLGVTGSIDDTTASPDETINYASCHDRFTNIDKYAESNPEASFEERKKMDWLAQGIVMTSQGIAFFQGGDEFLRNKHGDYNSVNSGDEVNQFDWSFKAENMDSFNFYKGLNTLRLEHPAFRMRTAADIHANLTFINSPNNTIAFTLNNNANGDSWKKIAVIYNPNKEAVDVKLPGADQWTVVVNDIEAGVTPVENGPAVFTGTAKVQPISMMVLYIK